MDARDSDTPDPLLGKRAGSYMVLQKIGLGAIGTVYQAMDTTGTKRLVALKVMHRTEQRLRRADGADGNPFAREQQVARAVQHPGVVRIYDIGHLPDGRYFAAMEYIEGLTLEEELKHRGQFPWREALDLLIEVAGAVGALHDADIIHRDLKPANVMVYAGKDGKAHIKLIDLGLARLAHEPDSARAGVEPGSVGTPAYMAPEVAVGAGTSKLADVYALGAIFYELLTGKPVIALRRPQGEQLLAYLRSKQELPSLALDRVVADVPLAVHALVRQLCARDPRERPRDAVAILAAVERLTSDLPVPPAPSGLRALGRAISSLFGKKGGGEAKKGGFTQR